MPKTGTKVPVLRNKVGARSLIRRRRKSYRPALTGAVTAFREDTSEPIKDRITNRPYSREARIGDYVHVSDLLSKCVRQHALGYIYKQPVIEDRIFPAMENVFAIGMALQETIVKKLKYNKPDELFGLWKCPCEHSSYQGVYTEVVNMVCDSCGKPLHTYHETVIENPSYLIRASLDIVLLSRGSFYIIESKSIKKENWERLTAPEPNHLLQVVFYWWMAREAGWPVYDTCSVIYVNKSFGFGNPYKEFVIKPEEHVHRLEPYLEEALSLKKAKAAQDNSSLPARVCPRVESPQARKCSLVGLCFGIDE